MTHRVSLAELDETEGLRLIELLGKGQIPEEDAKKLFALAGCHPLYLTELARDLLAKRLVLPNADSPDGQVPISVRHILEARTSDLSPSATVIAQVLSATSKPMRLADLSRLAAVALDETASILPGVLGGAHL